MPRFTDATVVRSFRLTGATLAVLGQSITTDLVVEKASNGDLVIGLRNAGLVLGPVTVADASGVFVLTPTGAAGRVSGTLRLDVPGIEFGAGLTVATGEFQAMMQVSLVNDGPVTLLLDSKKRF